MGAGSAKRDEKNRAASVAPARATHQLLLPHAGAQPPPSAGAQAPPLAMPDAGEVKMPVAASPFASK
jgi:hypothetical protein